MLSNKEIAGLFHELASLMELYEENPFKIRSYENAYLALRKLDLPLLEMSDDEWKQLKGVGAAIAEKLKEIKVTGSFKSLDEFRDKTPEGVRTMLRIKGLGPKKVRSIWKELNIESPGELAYACGENRLIELKGFGPKLQEEIRNSILFFDHQKSLFLYYKLFEEAKELIEALMHKNPGCRFVKTGSLRRANPVLEKIEILTDAREIIYPVEYVPSDLENGIWKDSFPVRIYFCDPADWNIQLLVTTGGNEHFLTTITGRLIGKQGNTEQELFEQAGMGYRPPECRDLFFSPEFDEKNLIEQSAIYGVIHTHTTYSDGMYSIEAMAEECIRLGYQYLVISDHSRSAFYANGLSIERIEQQWREIDQWNKSHSGFHIFKSIESDILNDGSLDYPDEILQGFDLVIASIHSNLKMEEAKAMKRLIQAIENPYTRILGHPTGRILLSRPGYPVNHKVLLDACAANGVVVELNANPLRLDIDWQWIPYAMERGVKVSINPDAHNLKGIQDIRFGLLSARKGGLLKNLCLNSMNITEFKSWILEKNNF